MSPDNDNDRLDAAIDEVARRMTEGAPDAGLRARVLERIDEARERRSIWRSPWVLSPIAVAAIVLIAIVVARPFKGRNGGASSSDVGRGVGADLGRPGRGVGADPGPGRGVGADPGPGRGVGADPGPGRGVGADLGRPSGAEQAPPLQPQTTDARPQPPTQDVAQALRPAAATPDRGPALRQAQGTPSTSMGERTARQPIRSRPVVTPSDIDALAPPPLDVDSIRLAALPPGDSIRIDPLETITPIDVAPLGPVDIIDSQRREQ